MQIYDFSLQEADPTVCPICDTAKPKFFGARDFNESCNDHFQGSRTFPDSGKTVRYWQCKHCQFVFTNSFDEWKFADYAKHIYNDDYIKTDTPFLLERPRRNAQMVAGLWYRGKENLTVLDYGGGTGIFAAELMRLGMQAKSCDVFYGSPAQNEQYPVVTCFEVIEHVPARDQKAWFAGLTAVLERLGTLLLSTELADAMTIEHWYIRPRNGHISIHSSRSLSLLAASFGLEVYSLNNEMHFLRGKRS